MSLSGRAAGRRGSRFGLREETQDRGIIFVPLRFIGPTGSTQIPQTEVIAERAQTPFRPHNPNLIRCPISRHASLSEPSLLLAPVLPALDRYMPGPPLSARNISLPLRLQTRRRRLVIDGRGRRDNEMPVHEQGNPSAAIST